MVGPRNTKSVSSVLTDWFFAVRRAVTVGHRHDDADDDHGDHCPSLASGCLPALPFISLLIVYERIENRLLGRLPRLALTVSSALESIVPFPFRVNWDGHQ